MLERWVGLGRQHDSGAAGEVRKDAGRLGQRAFESAAFGGGPNLAVDPRPFLPAEIAELQQRVDEEAQALLGRKPPGAGVGRVDKPELLEVLHHVADGGGRQRDRQHARQMPRAHRLAGRQVRFHDAPENFARTSVQIRERAEFGGRAVGG